jgi:hypothetical protein
MKLRRKVGDRYYTFKDIGTRKNEMQQEQKKYQRAGYSTRLVPVSIRGHRKYALWTAKKK